MFAKLKVFFLFVSIVSCSCIVFSCIGKGSAVNAEETKSSQGTECPLTKSEAPCKAASGCVIHCCERMDKCHHENHCHKKHICHTACEKRSECPSDGDRCVSDMLSLTRCAKKELLKEKIKKSLENKIGTKLDKAADLLADAMLEEYKTGMQNKERYNTLKKNLGEVFSGQENK